jgi:predicted MFS family arabinose efflux permease
MTNPSRRSEFRSVAILSLGFGLVGIDRFLISTLYPVIARDLHLNYGDIGLITGALAIAFRRCSWAICRIISAGDACSLHRSSCSPC